MVERTLDTETAGPVLLQLPEEVVPAAGGLRKGCGLRRTGVGKPAAVQVCLKVEEGRHGREGQGRAGWKGGGNEPMRRRTS